MTVKRYTALSAAAVILLLAGCGKKEQPKPEDLACGDPAVIQNIQNSLQQAVKGQARTFAKNDTRGFVDADKVIAAAAELTITLNNPQQDNSGTKPYCQADLSITISPDTLKTAQTNAPLLYGDKTLAKVIGERTGIGSLTYKENGILGQTLKYTPAKDEKGSFSITYADNGLDNAANALSAALLPYGIKSLLLIDGKAVRLEDALKQVKEGGKIEVVEETASEPEAASSATADPMPEVLTPPAKNEEPAPPGVSDEELEQAHSDYRAADREINNVWRDLDSVIQQGLRDEQREWINRKNAACRRAAAQADSPERAEYLRLQCDSRQTRERIQYLRDYSVQ